MAQLFPHSALLALQAMLYIAKTGSYELPVKGQQIEQAFTLNPRALEAILRKLAHQGLLQARSGATGGYYLSTNHRITLDQIILPFIALPIAEDLIDATWATHIMPTMQEASAAFVRALACVELNRLLQEPVLNFEI